jgi:hypothetical protein
MVNGYGLVMTKAKFDEQCPPGEHELKISVEDCVGNRTERTYKFVR